MYFHRYISGWWQIKNPFEVEHISEVIVFLHVKDMCRLSIDICVHGKHSNKSEY